MHARAATLATLLVATALAGCLGDGDDDSAPQATLIHDPADPTNETLNRTFEAPVADFFPSPAPAFVNEPVLFDAAKSLDPEGGNLTYAWDLGDGATADGRSPEHAYDAPGSFRVELTVTSDVSGLSDTAGLDVEVVEAADVNPALVVEDAGDDAAADASELLRVSLRRTAGMLQVGFQLADVPDTFTLASPVTLHFVLNDAPYEVYGLGGDAAVYDHAGAADVAGASVLVDPGADTVLVEVPLAELAPRAPYTFYAETRLGEPLAHEAQVADDRAPDEGSLPYDP